jgi:hypothetical protein
MSRRGGGGGGLSYTISVCNFNSAESVREQEEVQRGRRRGGQQSRKWRARPLREEEQVPVATQVAGPCSAENARCESVTKDEEQEGDLSMRRGCMGKYEEASRWAQPRHARQAFIPSRGPGRPKRGLLVIMTSYLALFWAWQATVSCASNTTARPAHTARPPGCPQVSTYALAGTPSANLTARPVHTARPPGAP